MRAERPDNPGCLTHSPARRLDSRVPAWTSAVVRVAAPSLVQNAMILQS
jgi:hypothetical protein